MVLTEGRRSFGGGCTTVNAMEVGKCGLMSDCVDNGSKEREANVNVCSKLVMRSSVGKAKGSCPLEEYCSLSDESYRVTSQGRKRSFRDDCTITTWRRRASIEGPGLGGKGLECAEHSGKWGYQGL